MNSLLWKYSKVKGSLDSLKVLVQSCFNQLWSTKKKSLVAAQSELGAFKTQEVPGSPVTLTLDQTMYTVTSIFKPFEMFYVCMLSD